jgi:hypothetical protein
MTEKVGAFCVGDSLNLWLCNLGDKVIERTKLQNRKGRLKATPLLSLVPPGSCD